MAQISSTTGLISGINISDLVSKLMAISQKPRNALSSRNDDLTKQQTANTELAALLYSVKYISDNLGKAEVYGKTDVTSSNSSVISVKSTGTPAVGSYVYTALRKAQNQQLLSSGFESASDAIGTGKITFRFGNDVEHAINLSDLGGGAGFSAGKILITDRSGARAEIDLTAAQTIDDVLAAINNNTTINVTAELVGDRIQLTDNTHQTSSNLKVQQVGTGNTAASLGLSNINVAADTALGQDIIYLSRNLDLNALNDGLGVETNTVLPDISYKLHDGTAGEIDLSEIISGSSTVNKERTLGEIMDKINAAAPGKLKVEIAPDGQRLILTDLTQSLPGSDEFQVTSLNDSPALKMLGLDSSAVDGVITGSRIISGGKTVLLSSLNGGKGLGQLGTINLTDRNGGSANVDLSQAETLEDVINAINSAGVQITAKVNQARNGIELADTSGSTNSNLIVANGDAANTADKLQIAVDDAVNSVNSGDLHLKIIGLNTKLADLNGGAGVTTGKFRITNSTGASDIINVNSNVQTVGDLLKAINFSSAQVLAEINGTGDGIVIRDSNGGSGTLKVEEYGSTTAGDLNLLGGAKTVDISGQTTQVIDGSTTHTIDLSEGDTLQDLRDKINQLNAGLSASIFNDGSNKPYRLLLASSQTGNAGKIMLDTSQAAINFDELVQAQRCAISHGPDEFFRKKYTGHLAQQ